MDIDEANVALTFLWNDSVPYNNDRGIVTPMLQFINKNSVSMDTTFLLHDPDTIRS